MADSIVFYTHDKTIELEGKLFDAGVLTANLLNFSPELYRPIHKKFKQVRDLAERYETNLQDITVWQELNHYLEDICNTLRKYTVFQILLGPDEDEAFSDVHELTQKDSLSNHYLVMEWEYYKQKIEKYDKYLYDLRSFNGTIRNFIKFFLMKLKANSPENYAEALFDFLNGDWTYKLVINPLQHGSDCYTVYDKYEMSYIPRKLPDGRTAICQQHITDSLQAFLKADFMLALNSGHNIRRCAVCNRHFLVKSGAHTLYCDGACPHAPNFTCRQFGTYEVQKELAKDIPKIRAKNAAFARIEKDMKRGAISREDARKAKDCVRDMLYDGLRNPLQSTEDFENMVSSQNLYSVCNITRISKPKGRPKKGGDAS